MRSHEAGALFVGDIVFELGVRHTSGVNFCPLVHGVAEFGSPASVTLFGRFPKGESK